MLGKASEIRTKQITRSPLLSFSLEEHRNHKTLNQLLDEWLHMHPDYQIISISFSTLEKTEMANIIYKESGEVEAI